MTLIYLIRHGENEYVGKGKIAGWLPGVHLNEKGKAQAKALTNHFEKIPLQAIYSSPLERTVETASPLAEAKGLKIVEREGLGEIRYGSWEGRSLKVLRKRKLWPIIQSTPSLARFPDGESFVEAQDRVVSEIEFLRSRHKGKKGLFACVSHADVIKLILAHYIGLHIDLFQRLSVLPASISALHIDPGIHLLTLNDTGASRAAIDG